MSSDREKPQPQADADLEREIRRGRKFTPKDALARLAGPGAMKGASPVSPLQQAETEVGNWLRGNVSDPAGALQAVLHRNLEGSERLLENIERPLNALASYCRDLLQSEFLLQDLVREVDVEWGRRMDERPYFDLDGRPAQPGDPYTINEVRAVLGQVAAQLNSYSSKP